jgi:tetratricopeptide (TPR) repeat protein
VGGRYLTRYHFTHALFQEYFYTHLSAGERRLLHGEVGTALEGLYAGRTERILAELAQHYTAAGWVEQAITYLQKAGQAAAASYAHQEAVDYFSQALELAPGDDFVTRFALLENREKALDMLGDRVAQRADLDQLETMAVELGEVAQAQVALRQTLYGDLTNDYAKAMNNAEKALKWAQQAGEITLAAKACMRWGQVLMWQSQYATAQAKFQIGLEYANAVDDQDQQSACLNGLGNVAYLQGDFLLARTFIDQSLKIDRDNGFRSGESIGIATLGEIAQGQGDFVAAKDYHIQALAISQQIGNRNLIGLIQNGLGFLIWSFGDHFEGKRHIEKAFNIAREIDNKKSEGISLLYLGLIAYNQGNIPDAERYYVQALDIFREIGDRRNEGTCIRQLAAVSKRWGDENVARINLEESLAIYQETCDRWGEGMSWNELGVVALAQGDLRLAESYYQKALAIRQELNQFHYLVEDWAGLAKVKLVKGDSQCARGFAEQFMEYVHENPRLIGTEHPMRTYRFFWEVWTALREAVKADQVLAMAANVIQDYLDKNNDPEVQAMYLRQPHHAVLWEAWQEKKDK